MRHVPRVTQTHSQTSDAHANLKTGHSGRFSENMVLLYYNSKNCFYKKMLSFRRHWGYPEGDTLLFELIDKQLWVYFRKDIVYKPFFLSVEHIINVKVKNTQMYIYKCQTFLKIFVLSN